MKLLAIHDFLPSFSFSIYFIFMNCSFLVVYMAWWKKDQFYHLFTCGNLFLFIFLDLSLSLSMFQLIKKKIIPAMFDLLERCQYLYSRIISCSLQYIIFFCWEFPFSFCGFRSQRIHQGLIVFKSFVTRFKGKRVLESNIRRQNTEEHEQEKRRRERESYKVKGDFFWGENSALKRILMMCRKWKNSKNVSDLGIYFDWQHLSLLGKRKDDEAERVRGWKRKWRRKWVGLKFFETSYKPITFEA